MPRTKEQFEKIREETRAKILNTALELFAKKGYSNTSISEIARSAEISKGLAYNYFESKQKLMEEVIQILFVEIGSMFSILETTKDPFEKVQIIIDLMFDWLEDKEDFWRLYASLLMQEEIKETVEKISENFLEEMFKEMEENWEGTIDWPGLLAALKADGYKGPLDIEINLSENPDSTYLRAKEFLEEVLSSFDVPRFVETFKANPCMVTQREVRTPNAQIFLIKGVPTSSQTPVSPSLLSPFKPYSAIVKIITSSSFRI